MQGTFEMLLSHVGVVIKDHSQQTEAETPDHRLTEGPGWGSKAIKHARIALLYEAGSQHLTIFIICVCR